MWISLYFLTVLSKLSFIVLQTLQMSDVAKDQTAGTVGGPAQLICGHLDTIMVKLQSQPTPLLGQAPNAGAIDVVEQTLAVEGPRGS